MRIAAIAVAVAVAVAAAVAVVRVGGGGPAGASDRPPSDAMSHEEEPVDADTEYLLLRSERVRRTMRMRRAGGAGEGAAPVLLPQQGVRDSVAVAAATAASHLRPSAAALASTTAAARYSDVMQPSPTSDGVGGGGSSGTPSKASTRRASSGGSGGGSSSGTGTRTEQLAERISDEFLTCKICDHTYTSPKCLSCMHSFCEDCIERQVAAAEASYKSKYSDFREFACPLCRKRTQLPPGGARKLPDNFLLSSLHEVIRMQRPSKMPYCDICRTVSKRMREAAAKCIDCSKLLCAGCVQQHRDTKITRNHSVFDVEVEKDIRCAAHEDEVVRFYCEPCERCVCVLCTFADEHRGHEISQFGDAVQRYKESIDSLLRSCKERLVEYERRVESVGRCEAVARQAEDKIRQCAADMIGQIRARERQLLEELRNAYGADTMALVERRADLQATLDGLKSACSLTELLLRGKGVELLLLKKDVADKLAALSRDAVLLPRPSGGAPAGGSGGYDGEQRLPATIGKTIKFVPGIVDLGYLHDMDRPLLTRRRYRRALTSSLDYRSPTDDDDFGEGGVFAYDFDSTVAPPLQVTGPVKVNVETHCAETQTPADAAGANDSGAAGRGVGARTTRSVDVAVMTDRWPIRPTVAATTCEQAVQVTESDQPRRYGARADDAATSYGSTFTSNGTPHDSPSSVVDGVITRRRRRIDRTRTTANVENLEQTTRATVGDEAGGDGGNAEARAARRLEATNRTARRFHLDSGRLRKYKSFEDDSQASAYI